MILQGNIYKEINSLYSSRHLKAFLFPVISNDGSSQTNTVRFPLQVYVLKSDFKPCFSLGEVVLFQFSMTFGTEYVVQ